MKGNAKGSILLHTKDLIHQRLGTQGWDAVVRALSEETAAGFNGVMLSGSWYPMVYWNELMDAALPRIHTDERDAMRVLATQISRADLGNVHRLVLKLGSPEFIMRRTGQIWSRYFDIGELVPNEVGSARWTLTLEAPRDPSLAPQRHTCGAGVTAWINAGLELSGTRAKVLETRCRFDDAPRCEFEVSW